MTDILPPPVAVAVVVAVAPATAVVVAVAAAAVEPPEVAVATAAAAATAAALVVVVPPCLGALEIPVPHQHPRAPASQTMRSLPSWSVAQVSHQLAEEEVKRLSGALVQQQAENAALQGQCADLRLQLRTVAFQGPKRSRSAGDRVPTTPDRLAVTEVDMARSPDEQPGARLRRLEDEFPPNGGC